MTLVGMKDVGFGAMVEEAMSIVVRKVISSVCFLRKQEEATVAEGTLIKNTIPAK